MEYKVIRRFEDNDRIYEIGDPYEGSKAPARISTLTNPEKNKYGQIYLEKVEEKEE
ncbi:termination factor Rho [Enterococcus wangshanyuanii]|uniref:Uncharacterized protein n=1 Tax=Enterococcus wangshanyuanii TaxID=2005703 RepID=A0ABQ1NTA5_9ENTE|nr:termination factor Rho [Enterococcus wangshanyuanii]GGC84298.1 hypothetical protein GCM10011573_12390 [Enterococcus wangshanyuanii]